MGAQKTVSFVTLSVTELDRKPSSCPYLYAWNGERFEFITDFMGGGEMGYLEEPGRHNTPDPDEYVRIRGDQLKERNGRYELRVTNELEEALFADRFQLIAVAHPQDVEVYPNEGMTDPPRAFQALCNAWRAPTIERRRRSWQRRALAYFARWIVSIRTISVAIEFAVTRMNIR